MEKTRTAADFNVVKTKIGHVFVSKDQLDAAETLQFLARNGIRLATYREVSTLALESEEVRVQILLKAVRMSSRDIEALGLKGQLPTPDVHSMLAGILFSASADKCGMLTLDLVESNNINRGIVIGIKKEHESAARKTQKLRPFKTAFRIYGAMESLRQNIRDGRPTEAKKNVQRLLSVLESARRDADATAQKLHRKDRLGG